MENPARDIKTDFPGATGYSVRYQKCTEKLEETDPDMEFVQQAAAQIP